MIGTVERYIFAALDTAVKQEREGKVPSLPLWLTPVQVRIVPVSDSFTRRAHEILSEIEEASVRADLDDRPESISKRVRDAEVNWIPYIVVIGEKEMKTSLLNVRKRETGEQRTMSVRELVEEVTNRTKGYPKMSLKMPSLLSQRPVYKL